MVNNVVILILLIIVLIFFIGLIIFINTYCIQYLCTPPPESTDQQKAKKALELAGIKKIRDQHITHIN